MKGAMMRPTDNDVILEKIDGKIDPQPNYFVLEIAESAAASERIAGKIKQSCCILVNMDLRLGDYPPVRRADIDVKLTSPFIVPYDSRIFDVVIVRGFLHYVVGNTWKVINEVKRVLKDGGMIIVVNEIPFHASLWHHYMRLATLERGRLIFTNEELVRMLNQFEDIDTEEVIISQQCIDDLYPNDKDIVKDYFEDYYTLRDDVEYKKVDGKAYMDMKFMILNARHYVREGLSNSKWWDGPARYQHVNRNVVSAAQRDKLFEFIMAVSGPIGLDIGGNGLPYEGYIKNRKVYGLNIHKGNDVTGDAMALPFVDSSLDYIVNSHTMEHIPDVFLALKEFKRALKPGALAGGTVPDVRHFEHSKNVPNKRDEAPSEMTPYEFRQMVNAVGGFEILLLDTNQNNFDFNYILRKKEVN
jgi:ubiquinone/menaquinone biosynthesis C-methylase UbiE